jgi:regulatory protein
MLKAAVVRKLKGSLAEVKRHALRLLYYRSRSRKEMLQRLGRKRFRQDHITAVIDSLEKSKLINDDLLASDLFRYCIERKQLGPGGIRMFLAKRGIPEKLIDRTMSDHTIEMEELSARALIDKKIGALRKYPDNVIKRRLWGMLQRRGYSFSSISKALREKGL